MLLTMGERFEDLRKGRNLTLNELAKATKLSRSALNKYEHNDFKDISPFSIMTLAKFYDVTADYLMGLCDMKNHSNAEIHELHLSDKMLKVLKSGRWLCKDTRVHCTVDSTSPGGIQIKFCSSPAPI